MRKLDDEEVRRVAERYHSTRQAAQALRVNPAALNRRMKELGVVPRWRRID